jgi:hypothetical protein
LQRCHIVRVGSDLPVVVGICALDRLQPWMAAASLHGRIYGVSRHSLLGLAPIWKVN